MSGYGPETITHNGGVKGKFYYFVHNFSGETPLYNSESHVVFYK